MSCLDADVKDDIFFSICEKEEPDVICNTSESDQVNRLNGPVCENKPVLGRRFSFNDSKVITLSCDVNSCLAGSSSTQLSSEENVDINDVKIKEENFDESAYFIDSAHVNNLSHLDSVDIKRGHDKEDRPYIVLEQLFQNQEPDYSKYYCEFCKFSTFFKGNLSRHIKYKHSRVNFNEKHACNRCSFTCAFPGDLRRHLLKHEGKYVHNCHFCDYGINKKYRMYEHIFKKHVFDLPEGTFEKTKKCYICDFKTKVKPLFLTHFLDNHKMNFIARERKINYFPCELCSYVATSKHTLIVHIDGVHKKIRPYACHLCDYSANRHSDLRIHISAKHDKITPFKCENCGYASSYKKHLRRHVLTQHVHIKPRKNQKRKTYYKNKK